MIPNTFVPMTTIESAKVNANFAVLGASGLIQMYGGTVAPVGWLLCNGASYLRTDYPDLFAAISTSFGSADGTHFNVPDFRGRVGVGKDGTTEFLNIGTGGGEKTHQLTLAEIPSHNHGGGVHNHSGGDYGHAHNDGRTILGQWNGVNADHHAQAGSGESWFRDNTGYASVYINNCGTIISTQGSDGYHNNLQPYLTINYIIKI